jgi:2-polyprenyl-6-methoxyphenol hydroxylase-like FAD-dependent oxidoreductase
MNGHGDSHLLPVLIVGGGMGGMTTALALAKRGIDVNLLEQAQEFGEVGAGLQIGPNVMKIFDRLGILEQVNRVSFFPENLILMDALDGSEMTRVPLDAAFRSQFGYPYATLHRADLHQVLTDACRTQAGITLETGAKVVSFTQDGDQVTAELADGSVRVGRAMVGADGIWSTTRQAVLGDGEPRITGHIAYRAVLPMEEVPEHLRSNSVVLWAGPHCHVAHYPMRRGELFNIGAIFHSSRYEEGANSYGDPDELHSHFSGVSSNVSGLLELIEEWRMWVLRDRDPVDRWTEGRVALLGDSAHPTLQYLAQGAGMAIEDAWTLANSFDQNPDIESALEEYQRVRTARTARVTIMSRLYGQLYHAVGIERDVRKDMLRNWSPKAARRGFAWIYEGI